MSATTLETEPPKVRASNLLSSNWFPPLLIIAAGVLAYSNSFNGIFLLDDRDEILNNPAIRNLSDVANVMFNFRTVSRPLVSLSLAINYKISGVEPWSYHALNIIIHVLCGLTIFGVVRRTLTSPRLRDLFESKAKGLALASALIWVVHPLGSQAVTYTIQRAESMMSLFYLVTLYSAIRAVDSERRWVWYLCSVTACVAGMMSKQVMITAPLAVVIWDYIFIPRTFGNTVRTRWPLYAGLGASWAVLVGLVTAMPRSQSAGLGSTVFTPLQYLGTQCGVIAHYLRLAVWPRSLCFDYAWPKATSFGQILPGALLVGLLFIATVWAVIRKNPFGFAGAMFFLVLALSSSFVPLDDAAFEYRMYLPLASVVVVAVVLVDSLLERIRASSRHAQNSTILRVAVVLVVVSGLGLATLNRNTVYTSDFAMWSDVVAKRPANDRAHADLAFALAAMNRHEEALEHLKIACNLNPANPATQASLGLGMFLHGEVSDAIPHLFEAVRLSPEAASVYNSLGRALLADNRPTEAEEQFRKALSLNSRYPQAYLGLGRALEKQNRTAEAIENYRAALKFNQDWPEGLCQLAITLGTSEDQKLRDSAEGIRLAVRAVSLTENQVPGPLDILAAVYAEANRFEDAKRELSKAIEILKSAGERDQAQLLMSRLSRYEKNEKPKPPTMIVWR